MPDRFRRFDCPFCDRSLKVRTEHLHKKIFCPRCNTILLAQLDGDHLALTKAPEQTEMFGPPVHRDFIQAEFSDVDPDESELDEDLPVAAVAQEELPIEELPVAAEAQSKAEAWAQKHSEVQTRFDDICIRAGIGLLLIGIAMLLIPWVRTLLLRSPALPVDLTLIGLVVSVLAAGILAFTKRRRPKKMFGVLTGLAIPVAALALLTPTPQPVQTADDTRYLNYSDLENSGLESSDQDDRPNEFVGLTGDVPTVFLPAEKEKSRPADHQKPQPKRFSPNKSLSITPVDKEVKNPMADSAINQPKNEIPTKPLVPLGKREITRRSAAQIQSDFKNAMRNWKLHPATAESKKETMLNNRAKFFKKCSVNRRVPRESNMRRNYSVTQAAGRDTVFGNAIYRQLPIQGIDVAGKDNVPEIFVPISDGPEFDDTLAWDENFFLVGFNVNIESAVMGIQGVFAPFEDGQLNMEGQVAGPWYGRPPTGNQMQSVTSYGNPVYGVVVYRDKLDIVGLSLVVGL